MERYIFVVGFDRRGATEASSRAEILALLPKFNPLQKQTGPLKLRLDKVVYMEVEVEVEVWRWVVTHDQMVRALDTRCARE